VPKWVVGTDENAVPPTMEVKTDSARTTDEQKESTTSLMHALAQHDDIDATNITADERSDGAIDTWFDVTFEMQMWAPPLSEVEQVAQDHGFAVVSVGAKESGRDYISVTLSQA